MFDRISSKRKWFSCISDKQREKKYNFHKYFPFLEQLSGKVLEW
jgi:hypothetical protein